MPNHHSSPLPADLQPLLQAFSEAEDREALAALAETSPQILGDAFAKAAQSLIETGLRMGNYDTAEALRQRLDALTEIRAMKAYQRQDALAQAVIAFVQAADDAGARNAFAQHRHLLSTDAALKMLSEDFEANDPKAQAHLRRRERMLKALQASG